VAHTSDSTTKLTLTGNYLMTKQTNDPTLSPEQLASIYPRAKTYDEISEKRQRIELSKPKINPHHLVTTIAVRSYVLVMLLVFMIVAVAPILFSFGVISGVFFCFFFALLWMGVAWWQLSTVAKSFYFANLNLAAFILSYSVVAAPLTYGLLALAPHVHSVFLVCTLATFAHFCLCFIIMKLLMQNSTNEKL
jgi:hypothetical protein